jgi:hypothetical protein
VRPGEIRLEAVPPIPAAALEAVRDLLVEPECGPYGRERSDAWRRAAVCEGVEIESEPQVYALSPRNTRGATRA